MNIRSGALLVLLWAPRFPTLSAQQNHGFVFEGTSAYASVSNEGSDAAGTLFGTGGSATFGWSGGTSVRGFTILYTPSYYFSREGSYSVGTSLSHSVVATSTFKLRPKLFLNFSLNGQVIRAQENLFSDSLLGAATQKAATLDELVEKPSNAQILQASTSSLALSTRYLNSAAAVELSYRPTPRLSVDFRGGGTRMQALESDSTGLQFSTTGALAGAGISYSLSPRTQVGGEVSSQQVWTAADRTGATNVFGSLSRSMGLRWFLQAQAGVGLVRFTGAAYYPSPGPQFVGGGTIGFKANSHTLTGTVMQSAANPYGLQGASSTVNIAGAWSYQKPGRRWTVFASGGNQILTNSYAPNQNIWHANTGWTRPVTRDTDISIAYAYGTMLSAILYGPFDSPHYTFSARHGVQLTLRWHPPRPLK